MVGTINALVAAMALFVGGHFLLSSKAIRDPAVTRLTNTGFQGLYSLVVGAALIWIIFAYREAPYIEVWTPPVVFRWITVALMLPASLFLVAGVTAPNPTMMGGERLLAQAVENPASGIQTVTRHPFLWATGLWAITHLLVNGDAASIILMTGIAILSFGGMHHIDRRRESTLGAAWGPMRLTTSALPFLAIAQGRTKLDWRGIGLWRSAAALALYVALIHVHYAVFGISPLP